MSSLLDWNDHDLCTFGDGAAAVVLGPTDDTAKGIHQPSSDGRHCDLLKTSGGPSTNGEKGYLTMEGREVFKFAVDAMSGLLRKAWRITS